MTVNDEVRWILGALGAIAAVGLSFWWRVEAKQDKKIDDLTQQNMEGHNAIYKRINSVEDKMTEQHITILGKIEELWKSRHKE